ncbi:response regulator [Runella slithyformis]|uniref:Response regulator receiver protein n=1 Tax=Runella slithyformis (strain ATCC 29530 / DSM 19594 / LMG 11500 / NCIMB 11436 / LSU 4) TaxID=761193 RepID=A0A7U3ZQP8_RUNSL|nr:response regulator [Runella slithyformis]AEI51621.1 response regulator receiver protein [Runella slithyformis DSM 19594]
MGYKILIIEDEDFIRENIAEMLNLSGFKVETAINGRDGIDKLNIFQPDLILCDISMPIMNGYQVLETVRNSDKHAHTPFIFLTSMANPGEVRKGLSNGANDYITKPFRFNDLIIGIERQLGDG